MSITEYLARLEGNIRPVVVRKAPFWFTTWLYSHSRKPFLRAFVNGYVRPFGVPSQLSQHIWGIHFRSPLMNAAGMFKNGEGYPLVAAQGAGAYLAGTTTALPRIGNTKNRILHPFAPYPRSESASNWMGLPNDSHAVVAKRLSAITATPGCPIGASISSDPEQKGTVALDGVIDGISMYCDSGVDFLELNESCPNVPSHNHPAEKKSVLDNELLERLETVSLRCIRNQKRFVPIIVKFSNDIDHTQIPELVSTLINLGYSGINIGNTSTQYQRHRSSLHSDDAPLFDYFTNSYGGGLSGAILRNDSYSATKTAAESVPEVARDSFRVIRTGGVDSWDDIIRSQEVGVTLCQWYTGYFEQFSQNGHQLYDKLYQNA